jgi:hypothetical protein
MVRSQAFDVLLFCILNPEIYQASQDLSFNKMLQYSAIVLCCLFMNLKQDNKG